VMLFAAQSLSKFWAPRRQYNDPTGGRLVRPRARGRVLSLREFRGNRSCSVTEASQQPRARYSAMYCSSKWSHALTFGLLTKKDESARAGLSLPDKTQQYDSRYHRVGTRWRPRTELKTAFRARNTYRFSYSTAGDGTELEGQRNWCILILPYARQMLPNM